MRVELARRAQRFFRHVPLEVGRRVQVRVDSLGDDPFPADATTLAGEEYRGARVRRVRVGHYRIKYAVFDDEQLALVLDIDRRSRIHER